MLNKLLIFVLLNITLYGSELINIDNYSKKLDQKHTLVFFHMTYCPYCKKMIKKSFNNQNIQKKISEKFVLIDINIDKSGTIKYKSFQGTKLDFARSLNIHFYPTVLFINNKNEIVEEIKGYRSKAKFTNILNYISTFAYKTIDYETYLDSLEMNE